MVDTCLLSCDIIQIQRLLSPTIVVLHHHNDVFLISPFLSQFEYRPIPFKFYPLHLTNICYLTHLTNKLHYLKAISCTFSNLSDGVMED